MDKSLIDDAIEDCVSIESGGNTFGTSKSQTPSTTSAASYGNQFFIRRHESSPEEYTSASSRRAIFNIENVKKKPSVFDDKDSYVSDATWQPIAPLSKPAAALSENLARKYSGMAPIEEESIYCVSMRPGSPPCNILSDRNDKLIISHVADRSDKRIISHIDGPASEYIGDINSSFDDRSYAVDDTMIVTKETYENKRSKNNCDLPPPVPLEGRTEENYCNGKVLSFKEDVDIVWNENENKKQTSKLKRGSMDHIASRYVYYDNDAILEDEGSVYYVKQKYAYFVLIVSAVQIFLFAIMSGTCGIAPLDINQLLGPYPEALSIWGAKNTWGLLVRNEWWRLFSSSMLHAGVVHLIINVAVQVETSAFFEREWGWLRYILVYFLSSFNSTVASCIMEPASISVGSSGALMGIFGAKCSEIFCRSLERSDSKQQLITKKVTKGQIGGLLCSIMIISVFGFVIYIDYSSLLGGFITGLFVGLVLFLPFIHDPSIRKTLRLFAAVGTFSTIVFPLIYLLSNVVPEEELSNLCDYFEQYFGNGYYGDNYHCTCF